MLRLPNDQPTAAGLYPGSSPYATNPDSIARDALRLLDVSLPGGRALNRRTEFIFYGLLIE